mgnify:CR=1 FL=1
MENVNVVIVDDNPMILNTLDEVISSEAGLSVIGRADNGKDAIDMIKDTQPDVVLLDLVMPQMEIGRRRKKPLSFMFTNCPGRFIDDTSPESTILYVLRAMHSFETI